MPSLVRWFRSASVLVGLVCGAVASPAEAFALGVTPNPLVFDREDFQGNPIGRARFDSIEIVRGVPEGGELLIGRASEDSYSLVLAYAVDFGPSGPIRLEVGREGRTGGGRIPGEGIDIVSVLLPLMLPGFPDNPALVYDFAETVQPGQRTERFFVVFDELAPGDEILAGGQLLTVVSEPPLGSLICALGLLGWARRPKGIARVSMLPG